MRSVVPVRGGNASEARARLTLALSEWQPVARNRGFGDRGCEIAWKSVVVLLEHPRTLVHGRAHDSLWASNRAEVEDCVRRAAQDEECFGGGKSLFHALSGPYTLTPLTLERARCFGDGGGILAGWL